MLTILLGLALLACLIYLVRVKRDISAMNEKLEIIQENETNLRLTSSTFDKDVARLAVLVNATLDKERQLIILSERANREFKQGITNISHDLRTPLTSSLGYIQMMKTGNLAPEKEQKYIQIIESRLSDLSGLMNELFDYTQIMEGKIQPVLEKVNISNLLAETAFSYYEEFTQADFQVEMDISETPVVATLDPHLLQRVFQNLIKNVLSHGSQYFSVKLLADERTVVFSNKIDKPNELDVERLFERFYTSDASRTSKRTGLGLAITKELIGQMNGEIWAELQGDLLSMYLRLPM